MSIADLRITEVHYNPSAGTPPFLEITNTGTDSVASGDFFVGNSDYGPQYYQVIGPNAILAPTIPAGATLVLVPSVPDTTGEVFVPPVPISQAEFEAAYGPLPDGAVYYNYPAFFVGPEPNPFNGDAGYTIGGLDIFGDSVYIPGGAALGQSAQVDSDGNVTFGTPTPGLSGVTAPVGPTAGDDVLEGGDAPTTLSLLDGDDTWTGVSDPASFVVGQYTDTIFGGNGNDGLFGGIGNDALSGDRDDDLIDGGDGNDNAWGGQGDDDLFGGAGLDRINGNSGDDNLFGGDGGDIIRGGKGEDYVEGGDQSDIIYGGAQSDLLYGGKGDDMVKGGAGADLMFGGSGNDVMNGGSFDDEIYGDHGEDKIAGGAGDDLIFGGISDDKLNGNTGDDIVFGGRGNDKLTGGDGNDELDGGQQGDRLFGGDGEDILHGSLGDDRLTGGADADTFVFAGTVNSDIITDFEVGVDKIDVTAYGPISPEDALDAFTQVGADVVIDLGGNGDITLQGIALEDLSLDDFIYLPDDIFVVG